MQSAQKRILELEEIIRHHQYLYYTKNQPTIPDKEYDQLFRELQELEKKHPEFASQNSPTQTVGSDLDNQFEKITHKIPVLSLENTYSPNELQEWLNKTGEQDLYSVEWKIDGASIVLYYEDGQLWKAVTRGTGGIGDDVTENIRTIKSIPLVLKERINLYVRGEVYMNFSDFESFNEEHGGKYANPRNLSAGSIKHKNSSQVARRPLKIFIYDGFFPENTNPFQTHKEIQKYLSKLNFPMLADTKFVKGSQLILQIEEYNKKKDKLNFPVDGLVIKLDNIKKRDALGFTSHSPRWARAYKFDAELKESTIEDIDYAIGRTGKITPRAKIRPIQLAGTTVTYATLHNQDFINEMKIGIGAKVLVAKRGEIIPAVEKVIEEGKKTFQLPSNCPTCGVKLEKKEDSVDLFCMNKKCPDREKNSILFYCQKKQMDIEGLGEKQVYNLYDLGYIRSIACLYELQSQKDSLKKLDGFGEKSVGLLLKGIEKSKQKDLKFLLPALGLSEIGHKVTELLIESGFYNISSIIDAANSKDAESKFLSIHGLGPITVRSIIGHFRDREVLELIKKLESHNLRFQTEKKEVSQSQIFAGQSWCVTGKFVNFQPRDIAMDIITKNGGRKVTSISSKTTHLLAGEAAGSKLSKAVELGLTILNEEEFLQILRTNNLWK